MMIYYYIYHCTGKCCFVRRIVEERIGCYAHFMIENICIVFSEPDRLLVSDKMHLMPFISQRLPKFCSQNTTASKGRITNNTYTHVLILLNEVKQIFKS